MFAIFENGGKQYKVKQNDVVKIEKNDCKKNDTFILDKILLLNNNKGETIIGTPYVKDVSIKTKVLDVTKDKKVLIFKKKRRHNYRRKLGHRQNLVLVKIIDIVSKNGSKKTKSNEVKKDSKTKISNEKVQPKE